MPFTSEQGSNYSSAVRDIGTLNFVSLYNVPGTLNIYQILRMPGIALFTI